jgi:hypothetical protein
MGDGFYGKKKYKWVLLITFIQSCSWPPES